MTTLRNSYQEVLYSPYREKSFVYVQCLFAVDLVTVIAMQIPCTHLQLNSEGFASMLSSSYPLNDSPIKLDDPLEAFRDFRDMLLT